MQTYQTAYRVSLVLAVLFSLGALFGAIWQCYRLYIAAEPAMATVESVRKTNEFVNVDRRRLRAIWEVSLVTDQGRHVRQSTLDPPSVGDRRAIRVHKQKGRVISEQWGMWLVPVLPAGWALFAILFCCGIRRMRRDEMSIGAEAQG